MSWEERMGARHAAREAARRAGERALLARQIEQERRLHEAARQALRANLPARQSDERCGHGQLTYHEGPEVVYACAVNFCVCCRRPFGSVSESTGEWSSERGPVLLGGTEHDPDLCGDCGGQYRSYGQR